MRCGAIRTLSAAGFVLAIVLAAGPSVRGADAPASQPTRFGSRMFEITWPDLDLRQRQDQLQAPLVGSELRTLAQTLLGVKPEQVYTSFNDVRRDQSYVVAQAVMTGNHIQVVARLRADDPNPSPQVDKFMDELQSMIQKLAHDRVAEYTSRAKTILDKRASEARRDQDEASERLEALRQELRQATGRVDVSAESLSQAAPKLDDLRQQLELDALAKQSRSEAITKAIARLTKEIELKVGNDSIVGELQKVVDAAEKAKFAKAQVGSGVATMAEERDAVAALAEARAKLLERQRDAVTDAGGGQLETLNRELITLSIDLTEIQAKLKELKGRQDGLANALNHVDDLAHAQALLKKLRAESDEAIAADRSLARKIAEVGEPTVVVTDRSDTAPAGTE